MDSTIHGCVHDAGMPTLKSDPGDQKTESGMRSESIEAVLTPAELIVSKVLSYDSRRGKPKSGTDWRDAAVLLRQFPQYKVADGEISQRLLDKDASATAMKSWQQLVEQDLTEDEDDDLNF